MLRLLLLMLSLSARLHAQSLETLAYLAAQNQKCLDSGMRMMECSRIYCMQMDSILNMAYNNLQAKLSSAQYERLKAEQKEWLKKRDKYFAREQKEFQKNLKSGEWGPEMYMVVYQDNAEFIKARNKVLINRLAHAGK